MIGLSFINIFNVFFFMKNFTVFDIFSLLLNVYYHH